MKIFLYKFIILLSIVCLTIFVVGLNDNNIYRKKSIDSNISRVRESVFFDSLDILFLGSSRTFGGVIPSVFDSVGIKTYNLGIATAGPCFMKMIWDDYCLFHKKLPQFIAIDISPQIFTSYPLTDNHEDYSIHRYLNRPLSNEKLIYDFSLNIESFIKLEYKSFIKGFSQLFNESDTLNVKYELNKQFLEKGYCPLFGILNDSIAKADSTDFSKADLSFANSNETNLLNLMNEITKFKIQIILHEIPTKRRSYFSKDFLDSYESFINKANLIKGVSIARYPTILPDRLFANPGHLNDSGAKVYSRFLLDFFLKNKLIKIE